MTSLAIPIALAAVVVGAVVYSSPGFLPFLCATSCSSECAVEPVYLTLVVLAGLFFAAVQLHRRAGLAAAEAKRKNELAMELMATRNKFMHTAESVRVGRAFKPRRSDIFVVTYPKCGTTWMTQIVHALRSKGDMGYGEITEVVPWDILAHDCGQKLDAPQQGFSPRVYKSHEAERDIPKGGRYVYVARDPLDAFLSFFKFLPAYTGLRAGDITPEQFADAIFAGASHSGQIWGHMLGWWARRKDPDVLWVFFEDLLADLPGSVRRIAEWGGLPSDEAAVRAACAVSSFEFMSAEANVHHFDDHFVRAHVVGKMGIAPGSGAPPHVAKVRRGGGRAGGSRAGLPAGVRALLASKWREQLAAQTGCADYAALRAAIRATPEQHDFSRHTAHRERALKAAGGGGVDWRLAPRLISDISEASGKAFAAVASPGKSKSKAPRAGAAALE